MTPVVGSLPWTPEENDLLRELALSGKHAAAIAGQMKRSEPAIRKRAVRLNLTLAKVQRWPKAKKG
jgi:hypothetical protein